MSSRAAVLVALCAVTAPLAAQQPADSSAILRVLLARVEAQRGVLVQAERRVEARTAPERLGRLQTEGRISLLVMASAPRDEVARTMAEADSALKDFGGIPDWFVHSIVLVFRDGVSDAETLLAAPAVNGRSRVVVDRSRRMIEERGIPSEFLVWAIAGAYAATLDRGWRDWLPRNYGIVWDRENDGDQAISDLASVSGYARGKECLAGTIRACRLWLGVDDDANAFAARFTPDELVAEAQHRTPNTRDGRACRDHDADACARVLSDGTFDVRRVPASDHDRASLLRALRERHGGDAVRLALADTSGSIGERMARAAGVPEDSLISEWRTWVLSRGRSQRVSAGVGDFASALIFILVLVAMATRSGRWR